MNPKELWYYKKGSQQRQKAKTIRNLRLINVWTEEDVTMEDLQKQSKGSGRSKKEVINQVQKYKQLEDRLEEVRSDED